MWKTFLASLLALFGVTGATEPQQKVQSLDPSTILFTTPTLSNDVAALEPVTSLPNENRLVFHEDEWSQVEFLPKSQLKVVQRILKEFKPFEEANRAKIGWRKVYVRKFDRIPVLSGAEQILALESTLGVNLSRPPIIQSAGNYTGQVKNGFTLALGGNVTLYGYAAEQSIPVLGADVGRNADDLKLTQAFMKLSNQLGLILVDWKAQTVYVSVTSSGEIEAWRP